MVMLLEYEQGRWNDAHCSTQAIYICKKPEEAQPATLSPAIIVNGVGHCPDGWEEYGT